MAKYFQSFGSLIVVLSCGCAGSPPPAQEAPSSEVGTEAEAVKEQEPTPQKMAEEAEAEATEEAKAEEQELIAALPTDCKEADQCTPPKKFARAACEGRYPGMAVAMFEKGTPWQRLYVNVRQLRAVNTYGGPTGDPLLFTEEVLLLRGAVKSDDGAVQVSGAADVDVLRWDGTCVTVRQELLSDHRMPSIKNATIKWRYLDEATQEGLLEAKYVKIRHEQQRSACRSSSTSNPSAKCKKATEKLNDAITVAVRGGLVGLPEPEWLPAWKQASR